MSSLKRSSTHLLATCILLFLPFTLSSCFYPNGSTAANDFPCNPDAKNSVCCLSGTICTDNGVCMDLQPGDSEFNRGSCTDKAWDDPACPTFCKQSNTGTFNRMAVCGNDGTFVCDFNSSSCSTKENVISIGIPVPYAIPSSAGASKITPSGVAITSSPSGTITNAPITITNSAGVVTACPTVASDSSSEGLDQSAKIGIGVGVTAGALLIGAAAFGGFFLGKRNMRKRQAIGGQFSGYGYSQMKDAPGDQPIGQSNGTVPSRAPSKSPSSASALRTPAPPYGPYSGTESRGNTMAMNELPSHERNELAA